MTDEDSVLFVRGSGNKTEDEDMWDDTALIQAYDKAVNLAKEEVAKRIAMDVQDRRTKQKLNSKRLNQTKKPLKLWTIGAPCRAVYSGDGEVYEAIISKFYGNSGMCLVEFVGYGNKEKVELNSLLESQGLQNQIAQRQQALIQNNYDNEEHPEHEEYPDSECPPDTPDLCPYKQTPKTKNKASSVTTEFSKASKPFFSSPTPPPPPLPPQLMARLPETDTDALSSMLMSWYISGFHTGYYHGLKQAKINQQKRKNCESSTE